MERSSSGGVKSLRAMFENANSDPDRGRSPGEPGNGTPDRPISKVRTAFVEVELSAQLAKKIRENAVAPEATKQPDSQKLGIVKGDSEEGGKENVAQEPKHAQVPLQKVNGNRSIDVKITKPSSLGSTKIAQSIPNNSATKLDGLSAMRQDNRKPSSRGNEKQSSNTDLINASNTAHKAPPVESTTRITTQPAAAAKSAINLPKPTGSTRPSASKPKSSVRATATERTKPTPTSRQPSSQPQTPKITSSRPQLTPQRSLSHLRSSNTPSDHRQPWGPSSSSKPPAIPPSFTTSHTTPIGVRSSTGFIKPRPKSPTRPINLPSHLTAHTASSAAKYSDSTTPPAHQPRPPSSRRASNISAASSARPSLSQLLASVAPPSSRKPSATFGPPPARPRVTSTASAATQYQQRRVPDDSFLARMMRPTASSASKVRGMGKFEEDTDFVRPRVAPVPRKTPSMPNVRMRARAGDGVSDEVVMERTVESVEEAVDEKGIEEQSMLTASVSSAMETVVEDGVEEPMSLKLPENATEELFKQHEPHIVGETETDTQNQVDLEHHQGSGFHSQQEPRPEVGLISDVD